MDISHPYYEVAIALRDACRQRDGEVKVGAMVSSMVAADITTANILAQLSNFYPKPKTLDNVEGLLAWFRSQGYGVSKGFQATAAHTNLAWILKHREGLPIAVAILLMGVARSQGLAARGVNFPGHFLIEIEGQLIDPLTFELAAVDRKLTTLKLTSLYADAESIGLRMLNNLKSLAMQRTDFAEVLNLLDVQMMLSDLDDVQATLQYERAEVWLKFGSIGSATEALRICIEKSSQVELQQQARAKIQQLEGRTEVQH